MGRKTILDTPITQWLHLYHRSMMKRLFAQPGVRFAVLGGLLGAALLLQGCGNLDVPRADNYPATGQKKARAVHHWDVLADDVAARVAAKLADWPPGEHPIGVHVKQASSFDQGFSKLLVVRLLERGIAVSSGSAEVELQVQAQIVQHQTAANNSVPMPWTRLALGVAVVRDWHRYAQSSATGIASGLAVGAALDLTQAHTQGGAAGGPTRTEVLITTMLQSGDRYLSGTADVYYIEPEDASLYQPPPPAAPLAPVKTWKVVTP